jgi:hypothetical protein
MEASFAMQKMRPGFGLPSFVFLSLLLPPVFT